MKKNKFNLLLTGLLSLAMVGCSSETEDVINPGGVDGETKTMTISFPNLKNEGTSYATATTAENTLSDVKVFVVNGNAVEQTPTVTVSGTTATVQVSGSGEREFYIAANTGSALSSITTKSGLLAAMHTPATPITTPLIMDAIETKQLGESFEVKMQRRVARFDIINNTETSITRAYITKGKTKTSYFRGGGTSTDVSSYDFPITVAATTGSELAPAFYLNPTTMGSDTEIAFLGANGKMYTVVSTAAIEANMRYIITLSPTAPGTITTTPDEWGNGTDLTGGETGSITGTSLTTANGAVLTGTTLNMKSATGTVVMSVTTGTSTTSGATATATGGITVVPGTVAGTPTYAGASYKQTHTVTVPQSGSGTQTVVFKNASNGVEIGTITVEYEEGKGGTEFVNPLSKFAYQNLSGVGTFVNNGDAYATAADYGKTDAYGAWFQWGRKAAFTNPSEGVTSISIPFANGFTNSDFINADGQWYTEAGDYGDIWTKLTNSDVVDSDPCPSGYHVPTVDDLLAVFPYNQNAGNYTNNHGDKLNKTTVVTERDENQIRLETGASIYYAKDGTEKTLYAIKKLGTEEAYALRWSYKGFGTDTYLEMACVPATTNGVDVYKDAASIAALFTTASASDIETRFFPTSGYRDNATGAPLQRSVDGYYWSSSVSSTMHGWYIGFSGSNVHMLSTSRTYGFAVRCVATN